jgi:SAM-dependent methyltransferase
MGSYMHRRRQLLAYLRRCHAALRPGGVVVLDTFGGPASHVPFQRQRQVAGGVRYTFEQSVYDPTTARALCHIHFRFADGSRLRNSFTYDWRRCVGVTCARLCVCVCVCVCVYVCVCCLCWVWYVLCGAALLKGRGG